MHVSHPVLLADIFEVWAWDTAHTAQDKYFKQAWVRQHVFIDFKKKKKKKGKPLKLGEGILKAFCFGWFCLVWHFLILSFLGTSPAG